MVENDAPVRYVYVKQDGIEMKFRQELNIDIVTNEIDTLCEIRKEFEIQNFDYGKDCL
jgi:hypothetical protein